MRWFATLFLIWAFVWTASATAHLVATVEVSGRNEIWSDGRTSDGKTRHPYLEWFVPSGTNRTDLCVLVVSCGGRSGGDRVRLQPVVNRLVRAGVTVARLTCRSRPEEPFTRQSVWEDVQRAVRVVRSQAKRRGFSPEKIGATGYSVGATAVLFLATSSETAAYEPVDGTDALPCNLLFAIPHAPVRVLDGVEEDGRFLPEFRFDERTCPMCLFHGGDDEHSPESSVRIYRRLWTQKIPSELHLFGGRPHAFHGDADSYAAMGSVKCWERLRKMGVPADLHTLVLRSHSFQRSAAPGTASYTWLDRIWEFLNERGVSGVQGACAGRP